MTAPSVSPELVKRVAALAGLTLPDEDLALLQSGFANHLAGADALRSVELDDIEPIVSFDPRW